MTTMTEVAADSAVPGDDVLLEVRDLVCQFRTRRGLVQAVSGVDLTLKRGEVLAIVGESGCGKSTTGRAIIQLPPPTSGRVMYKGQDLTSMPPSTLRGLRDKMQIIFQDPKSSLNPRRRVRALIGEGLEINGVPKPERERRVTELMAQVGLDSSLGDRRPRDLSGGQCQRVAIARAVALAPDLLVCDEPVASLDVSVQAQILNLLEETRQAYGMSLVFISHDLSVVHSISDSVAVMYLGKIVEYGDAEVVFARAAHPYTNILLDSIPAAAENERVASGIELRGEIPSPLNPPSGCRFQTRCPLATDRCADETPELVEVAPGQSVACHYPVSRGAAA